MNKCTQIENLLPDYSVGSLSKKKRNLIKQHLKICPECMNELNSLERTASILDSMPSEEPPDLLWGNIRREIIKQQQIKTSFWQKILEWLWWKRIPALATGLAFLILLTSVYFFIWRVPTEQQESTFYAEREQQTFSYWNTSFADKAALGMLVVEENIEGDNNETF